MADEQKKENPDIVRMYTAARKFPTLIGRFPDGRPVPFGPYTVPQLVGGFLALVGLYYTRIVWAHFGLMLNLALAAIVTIGVIWALGRLSQNGRSHLSRISGVGNALSRTATSRVDGRVVSISRPHVVGGGIDVVDTAAGAVVVPEQVEDGYRSAAVSDHRVTAAVASPAPTPAPAAPSWPASNGRARVHPAPAPWASDPLAPAPARYAPAAVDHHPVPVPAAAPVPVHAPARPAPAPVPAVPVPTPRVAAAAGTGVAQLLAIATDSANRRN